MGMEHTPDIDVIVTLNVKDEVGIASQHAAGQPWKAKLIGVPRRSGGRVVGDEAVRDLQRVDETDGNAGSGFPIVVVNCRFDVSSCRFARPNGFLAHLLLAWRTRFLRPLKYLSSTAAVVFDAAPSSRSLRRCSRS